MTKQSTGEVILMEKSAVQTTKPSTDITKPGTADAGGVLSIAAPVEPQHEIPAKVDSLLDIILTWPRPHDSVAEKSFCDWLKFRIGSDRPVTVHSEGAMSVTIACSDGKPSATLFSCHVDTMDSGALKDYGVTIKKTVLYDPNFGTIFLDKASEGTCLGADDGAGIWIMLKMIDAAVPGTYLFHRGEERGGISAKAISAKEGPWISQFDLAIAFDRPRNNEVITHQGGVRCASDKFANALCEQLNKRGFDYKPSSSGVYTDTKEYRRQVSECINLGVGYESQHTKSESQDYAHLHALMLACIDINWDALPAERDPSAIDVYEGYKGGYRGNYGGGGHGGYSGWSQRELHDFDPDAPIFPVSSNKGQSNSDNKPKSTSPTPSPKAQQGKSFLRTIPNETVGEEMLREIEDAYSLQDIAELCVAESDTVYQVLVTMLRQRASMQAEIDFLVELVARS